MQVFDLVKTYLVFLHLEKVSLPSEGNVSPAWLLARVEQRSLGPVMQTAPHHSNASNFSIFIARTVTGVTACRPYGCQTES